MTRRRETFRWLLVLLPSLVAIALVVAQLGRRDVDAISGERVDLANYARQGVWSEGRLWVQERDEDGAPGTFVDEHHRAIAEPVYSDLALVRPEMPLPLFNDGVAVVGYDGGYAYLDHSGKRLGKAPAAAAIMRQSGELLMVADNGGLGYIDRRGDWVIKPKFEDATPFYDGIAAAKKSGSWQLIDAKGKAIMRELRSLRPLAELSGHWIYQKESDSHFGLLNPCAHLVTAEQFDDFKGLAGGLLGASSNGLWGVIGSGGEIIASPRYGALQALDPAGQNLAFMNISNRWGVIDGSGVEIIPASFDNVNYLGGVCLAQVGGLWGVVDGVTGETTIAPQYNRILPLEAPLQNLALVELDRDWGVVDVITGEVVIPLKYSSIEQHDDRLVAQDDDRTIWLGKDGREITAGKERGDE